MSAPFSRAPARLPPLSVSTPKVPICPPGALHVLTSLIALQRLRSRTHLLPTFSTQTGLGPVLLHTDERESVPLSAGRTITTSVL